MNALKLYRDFIGRDVELSVEGGRLKVDAPTGELTARDTAALLEAKSALIEFLSPSTGDGKTRRSEARWAGREWIRVLDPETGDWHDVKATACLPGVIAEANRTKKGGAA